MNVRVEDIEGEVEEEEERKGKVMREDVKGEKGKGKSEERDGSDEVGVMRRQWRRDESESER